MFKKCPQAIIGNRRRGIRSISFHRPEKGQFRWKGQTISDDAQALLPCRLHIPKALQKMFGHSRVAAGRPYPPNDTGLALNAE
jgi:hypothetical protein